MTSSTAGKNTLVKIASAAAPSTHIVLGGLFAVSQEGMGANINDAEFGDQFIPRLAALRDARVSLEGARRASDAGQVILMAALASGASVWITVRPFLQEMRIAKFTTDVQVDGRAEFTCDLEGTGLLSQNLPGLKLATEDLDYIRTQGDDFITTESD